MHARYHDLTASADDTRHSIHVRFRLENRSSDAWNSAAGYHLGWQLYDPVTATFITEGEWVPFAGEILPGRTESVEFELTLPPQSGPYRIYLSPLHDQKGWFYPHGGEFVLIDATVEEGHTRLSEARVITLGTLRRESFLRAIPKAFTLPVASIVRNRALIRSMTRRDVLARYRGSFGDALWAVLNPLLLMSTYFFVFGIVLRTRFGPDQSRTGFALYFLAGMLPWLAFAEAVGRAPYAILEHRNFVKKLVFPVETLPVVQVVAGFVTELFALAVFAIFLLVVRGGIPVTALWLPVLIIPQLLFTLGLNWLLAGTGAFMRDLGQIMGFVLILWFFLTPICYPESQLPPAAVPILKKNPVFVLVHAYRDIFLEGTPPQFWTMVKLWVVSIAVFVLGHAWFHKLRRSLADVI